MTDYNFEPRHKEMGRHIASGILNGGMIQIVKVVGQILNVIVLSRLLVPSDFGLIAMASPAYGFVLLVLDLGLTQATIQKPNLTHEEANTLFWINTGVGLVLAAILVIASPIAGWYYHEPRVVPLIAAMALLVAIGATGNQHSAIMTRKMEFGALSLISAVSVLGGLAVSIAWALTFGSYWSLYAGMVFSNVMPVAAVWIASGWRPSAPRIAPNTKHMVKFGAGITVANLAAFFWGNTDNILIGHRWGNYDLGLYDRAYKLLLFPVQRIIGPIMSPLVPVLSRLADEPARYREIIVKTIGQLTLAIWPGIMWAMLLSDTLVPALVGQQWAEASKIFKIFAMASFIQVFNSATPCILISQGRSGDLARLTVTYTAIYITGFVIGLPYGTMGVATAYVVCEFLCVPFLWRYIAKQGPIRPQDILFDIIPQVISALAAGLALYTYRTFVQSHSVAFLAIGLAISYATAIAIMSLSPQGRNTLKHSLHSAKRLMLHFKPNNGI